MLFAVDFDFTLDVVPKGCRRARPETFKGSAELSIPHTEGTQAPVALRVSEEPGKTVAYRFWNSRLWTQYGDKPHLGDRDKSAVRVTDSLDKLAAIFQRTYGYHDKSEAEINAELSSETLNYVFIDGILFQEGTEPYLGVEHGFRWSSVDVKTSGWQPHYTNFRADGFEKARECAVRFELSESKKFAHMKSPIEVLLPEVLKIPKRETCEHADVEWNGVGADSIRGAIMEQAGVLSVNGTCQACGGYVALSFHAPAAPALVNDDEEAA